LQTNLIVVTGRWHLALFTALWLFYLTTQHTDLSLVVAVGKV